MRRARRIRAGGVNRAMDREATRIDAGGAAIDHLAVQVHLDEIAGCDFLEGKAERVEQGYGVRAKCCAIISGSQSCIELKMGCPTRRVSQLLPE